MNQLEIQILRQPLRLSCPHGEERRLLSAVEKVDAAMTRILDAGKVRSRERIAILAAINLVFDSLEPGGASMTQLEGESPEVMEATTRWQNLLLRLDEALAEPSPPSTNV